MKPDSGLNNEYRVLLTEVLPYELPLMLNNEAFYRNMQDEKLRKLFTEIFSGVVKMGEWTIPFDYEIRRIGGEKSRKLSLMHPLSQLDCVEFYKTNDEYMLNICSRSPFSIRYIDKKARYTFPVEEEVAVPDDEMERHVELNDDEIEKRYRSYFSYKKYDLSYKFFESGDSLRLEQKFPYMMTIDVAGCFYHIYTHSVAWAIKGKEVAKDNVKAKTFENHFDTLMQHVNYNETNGIIVGPEISRIFAEIILQSVDLAVMRQLQEKGLRLGRDYEIRRYVDDSFVYAVKREILDEICVAYQEQLAFYKLDINKKKLEYIERPFTSGVSDAKREIRTLISEFGTKYLSVGEDGKYAKNIYRDMSVFSDFVKQFRSVVHQYGLTYGVLNKYALMLLLRQIRSEIDKGRVPSQGLLTAYAEIVFFIFSLDMHTTASYKLCSILDCLVKWAEMVHDVQVKEELTNRMRREAKRVLDIYQADMFDTCSNLEAQNLLLTLNLAIGMKVPTSQIETLFGIDGEKKTGFSQLNYFQICTLLYLIENDAEYQAIKEGLETEIKSRFSVREVLKKSEMAHLFFDIMTCPYLSKDVWSSVIKVSCDIKNDTKAIVKHKELSKPGRWFFDWDKNHDLTEFLNKKEYHSPYE